MPTRALIEQRIRTAATESFSRSGGPGGQNVNKVNTQVTLRVPIAQLGFSDAQLERVRERLGSRINSEGELVINASATRSQSKNREIAIARATDLIAGALARQRHRRPTRPTASSRERRLQAKRRRGRIKADRQTPSE